MAEPRKRDIIDVDPRPICSDEQATKLGLWNATSGCDGRIIPAPGGGIKCTKCRGWFCF